MLSDRSGQPLWEIQVLSFVPDATALVMAENPAQDPPVASEQYAIVEVRATYKGTTEPARLGESITFESVDNSNVTYDYGDECLIYPNRLDTVNDVYRDGTIEGNLCWSVQSATVDSLLLALDSGSTPYFMALQ